MIAIEEPKRNGPPTIGEWLRRRDSGELAQVSHVALKGSCNPPTSLPLYEGDVIMEYSAGRWNVCSGGTYFWSKWQRVETDSPQLPIRDAQGQLL